MIRIRLLQLAFAAGYAIIAAGAVAWRPDRVVTACAIIMAAIGYVMSRPLPDLSIDGDALRQAASVAVGVMALLIVVLVISGPLMPTIVGSFCLGNRLRAGGLGAAASSKL